MHEVSTKVAEPWCFGLASLGNKLMSTKRILPPQPLTYAVANQGTPDEAASDPESPQEVPSFLVMIPDGMTLDELAQRAPASGRQDEAGLAAQGQSASVAPADVSVTDASMEDHPLRRGDDDDSRETSYTCCKGPTS